MLLSIITTASLLLCIHIQLCTAADDEGEDEDKWQWQGLVQLSLASFFLLLGLHFLLYAHLATYALMKRYRDWGHLVTGDVLSCDPLQSTSSLSKSKWEVQYLYTASVHTYGERTSSRLEFRYPDKLQDKRFVRRLPSDTYTPRGTKVEVLVLPGLPKSGLTSDFAEQSLSSHSHCRTIMLLVSGLCLYVIIVYLQVLQVQGYDGNDDDEKVGWIVMGISHALIYCVARMWSDARWQTEWRTKYDSAVPIKTKLIHAAQTTDPLL